MEKITQKKVLVVDDDDLLRQFYCKVLESEGYLTVDVSNGDAAIEELKSSNDYVLAIIDLLMPIRTGWELIKYMKEKDKFKNIPIIALTGLAASFNEFETIETVCDLVMHKGSFELQDFIIKINETINKNL